MPDQPEECRKHHKILKDAIINLENKVLEMLKEFEKMKDFLFGGLNQDDGHLSFVDKVNILYKNQKSTRTVAFFLVGTFGILFLNSIYGLGLQINKLDTTVNTLADVVRKQQNIEIEIAEIKARIDNRY